jgi:hypothetical protein
MEVFKGSGHRVAVIWRRDKAYVVNDGGSDKVGKSAAMAAEDVR